jgi:dTDP-glucose 4,6-dehydratase
MAKILVIGSNSFSGASFCEYLLKQGHDVVGTSRSQEPNAVFLPYRWTPAQKNFRFVQIDLNHDLERLEMLMRDERFPIIVNFAAQSMVGESWKNPEHWMMTNVVSLVRLQQVMRGLDFLDRYVHITTPEVYGSTSGWITEDQPFNPSTPYAVSRAAGDMSLRSYFSAYQFPVLYTRAANVYGPGQQLYRIIPRTILFLMTGRKLQLHGGGHSIRSFIHMDDVSDATWRIAQNGKLGECYHISTNEMISIRELVQMLCNKLSMKFEDSVEVVGERLGKDTAYQLNSEKIRRELSWSDKISLSEGIATCIDWVGKNLETLQKQQPDYVHKP